MKEIRRISHQQNRFRNGCDDDDAGPNHLATRDVSSARTGRCHQPAVDQPPYTLYVSAADYTDDYAAADGGRRRHALLEASPSPVLACTSRNFQSLAMQMRSHRSAQSPRAPPTARY